MAAPDPVELLRALLRFDTSNPPGRERPCVEFLARLLSESGCEPLVLARDSERPNLVGRLRGRGEAPPLLLFGHIDVVPAGDGWTHPPFDGALVDGTVWGRGALDMKGGVAMLVTAFLRALADPVPPAGDLVLVINSDEETGGRFGAAYLVEEHAELFEGIRYALGEAGGFTEHSSGRRLYGIQVAEKRRCLVDVTLHGPSGHASLPLRGTAAAKLGRALAALERRRLPLHPSAVVATMLDELGRGLPFPLRVPLRLLRTRSLAGPVLRAAGSAARELEPLLRNTAVPTSIRAGVAANVIPSSVTVEVDGRIVPGVEPEAFLAELRAILDPEAEVELTHCEPAARDDPDLGRYPLLAEAIRELDPGGHPFPLVARGMTDARWFARLGIQTYGFLPMRLPPDVSLRLAHAADERVPANAIVEGTEVLGRVLRRFGG